MTSLIALYRRRGTVLLVTVGILLLMVLVGVIFGVDFGESSSSSYEFFTSLDTPLAQSLALTFWFTLSLLLGLVWARAFLGPSDFSEIFLVAALMGTASFPLLYVALSMLFKGLATLGGLPRITMEGHHQAYALAALFLTLLLGILMLIGREVISAARKPF